jgi:hypothetical protein
MSAMFFDRYAEPDVMIGLCRVKALRKSACN